MRHGKTTRGEVCIKWLDITQCCLARGRIADMACSDISGQTADYIFAVKIAGNMAHRPVRMEIATIEAGDTRSFLPAMLQCMEAKRDHGSRAVGVVHTENAAFLAQFIVIKWISGEHVRTNPFRQKLGSL
jgi:hypothetical protein